MRAPRIWASVAAAVLVSGGALASAAPAGAATTTIPVTCVNVNQQVNAVSVTLAPGDVLQYDKNSCYFFGVRAYGSKDGNSPATVGTVEYQNTGGGAWTVTTTEERGVGFPVAIRYTAPSDGTVSDSFYVVAAGDGLGLAGYLVTVTIGEAVVAAADAPPIPAWVQAYGRASKDATCRDGWDPSWDLWPNGGTGGFVCQRSIPSLG